MEMVELVHKGHLKTVSRYWLGLLRSYFRIEVLGVENIPKRKRALIVPNHSGFAGADAVLLTFVIKRETRRRARILAHRAFFDFSETLKAVSESHGLQRASIAGGVEILERNQLLIIFPEGESGNFKPTYERYHLAKFHTGFLRMAIQGRAPVVPTLVVGAEESHLNLGNINLSSLISKLRIPLPLNFLPLPAKWQIVFLSPIDYSDIDPAKIDDVKWMKSEAGRLQRRLQKELNARIRKRKYIYFANTGRLAKRIEKKIKGLKRAIR